VRTTARDQARRFRVAVLVKDPSLPFDSDVAAAPNGEFAAQVVPASIDAGPVGDLRGQDRPDRR
jgi:hypothetical protein